MVGRPKGSKNHPGHHAGGARNGAGRRKKEGSEHSSNVSDSTRAAQLLNRILPNHGSKVAKISITLEDGRIVSMTAQQLADRDARRKAIMKANRGNDSATDTGYELGNTTDNDDIIMLNIDPNLHSATVETNNSTSQDSLVPVFASYLQAANARGDEEDSAGLLNSISMDFPSLPASAPLEHGDMSLTGPTTQPEQSTSTATVLLPPPDISYAPDTAHHVVVNALESGIAAPSMVAGLKPVLVNGPYAFTTSQADAINTNEEAAANVNLGPTVCGPYSPNAIQVDKPIAIYFAVYERMIAARPVHKRPPPPPTPLDPQSANAEEPEDAKINGKRAPRSCVICQSFSCKGRGGRSHCPYFDPTNPAHQVRENRKYRKTESATPAPPDLSSLAAAHDGSSMGENANVFDQPELQSLFLNGMLGGPAQMAPFDEGDVPLSQPQQQEELEQEPTSQEAGDESRPRRSKRPRVNS